MLLLAGTPRPSKMHGGVGHGPARAVCVGPTMLGIRSVRSLIASEVWGCVKGMHDRDSKRGWGGRLAPRCSQDFGISPLPAASAPVNLQGVEVFWL